MKNRTNGVSINTVASSIIGLGIFLSITNFLISSYTVGYWGIATLLLSILIFSVVFAFLFRHINSSFSELISLANALKKQEYKNKEFNSRSNEANKIAAVLVEMGEEIKKASVFIKKIEDGDVDNDETINSVAYSDSNLSKSLISMRDKMKAIALEEKERNWSIEGLAKFVEILRATQLDVNELCNEIISKLVKYIDANQGGLFLYQEEEENNALELIACYAYDRKKYVNKKIEVGEGLVGQCFLEKEIIYLTEIPSNYLSITSGLGGATPKCLLLVPLLVNETVVGVMEIASFREFKEYQIEFVKKLGESIASTISNVQINNATKKLLHQSQIQGEQMKSQEEELRQNMEELSASQETMIHKEKLIQGLLNDSIKNEENLKEKIKEINSLKEESEQKTEKMLQEIEQNRSLLTKVIDELPEKIFLKDEEGRFMLFNSAFAATYDAETVKKLIGTNDFDNFSFELASKYRKVELEIIKTNEIQALYEDYLDANKENRINYCVKKPFILPNGKTGIMGYQIDVTEIKTLEKKVKENEVTLKEKLDEINRLIEIEQNRSLLTKILDELPEKIFLKDEEGRFLLFNSSLAATYDEETAKKLIGVNDFDLFPFEQATKFRQVELDIMESNETLAFYEHVPNKKGEIKINYCIKKPFKLPNGKIGILGYQVDVTDTKNLEKKMKASETLIKEKEESLLSQIKQNQIIIKSISKRKTKV